MKEWDAAQSSLTELRTLLSSNDAELRQLAADELQTTSADLETLSQKLSASLTPKDPFGEMPCLLEVVAGPGGQEGRLFADTLFRMYRQYCSRMGYRAQVMTYELADGRESSGSSGESALLEGVLEIQQPGAYGLFRGEAGMHRVQRIPSTEKNGRVHTSAVAVWVLPSFPENSKETEEHLNDPSSDFYIDPKEVRSELMRASGAGGQHVNKTESAIRLTHIPTGTVVSMQENRSQHRNREAAWHLLRSRVAQQRRDEREAQAQSMRDSVLSKDKLTRADKIRTYNFGQDRCTEHRSGLDVHNLPDVLEGGESLEKIVGSVQEWLTARDIRAMIAEDEAVAKGADNSAKARR